MWFHTYISKYGSIASLFILFLGNWSCKLRPLHGPGQAKPLQGTKFAGEAPCYNILVLNGLRVFPPCGWTVVMPEAARKDFVSFGADYLPTSPRILITVRLSNRRPRTSQEVSEKILKTARLLSPNGKGIVHTERFLCGARVSFLSGNSTWYLLDCFKNGKELTIYMRTSSASPARLYANAKTFVSDCARGFCGVNAP